MLSVSSSTIETVVEIHRTSSTFASAIVKDESCPLKDFEYETLVDELVGKHYTCRMVELDGIPSTINPLRLNRNT
jgi:hypothetical protein